MNLSIQTDKGCAGGGECSGLNGVELVCSPDGGSGNQAAVRVEVDVPLGIIELVLLQ